MDVTPRVYERSLPLLLRLALAAGPFVAAAAALGGLAALALWSGTLRAVSEEWIRIAPSLLGSEGAKHSALMTAFVVAMLGPFAAYALAWRWAVRRYGRCEVDAGRARVRMAGCAEHVLELAQVRRWRVTRFGVEVEHPAPGKTLWLLIPATPEQVSEVLSLLEGRRASLSG